MEGDRSYFIFGQIEPETLIPGRHLETVGDWGRSSALMAKKESPVWERTFHLFLTVRQGGDGSTEDQFSPYKIPDGSGVFRVMVRSLISL